MMAVRHLLPEKSRDEDTIEVLVCCRLSKEEEWIKKMLVVETLGFPRQGLQALRNESKT